MGILESIAGQVLGMGGKGGGQSALVNAVIGMIGNKNSGGLSGLVQQLAGSGLGDIVNSWVSTGENKPVTSEQLQQGLGPNLINQLGQQAGISPDQVTSQLTELLPQIIDKLTPDGEIKQDNIMSRGADLLGIALQVTSHCFTASHCCGRDQISRPQFCFKVYLSLPTSSQLSLGRQCLGSCLAGSLSPLLLGKKEADPFMELPPLEGAGMTCFFGGIMYIEGK